VGLPVPFLAEDRSTVERFGYGLLGPPEQALADAGWLDDPNADYVKSLGDAGARAYEEALNGKGGCGAQALRQFPEPSGDADQLQVFDAEFADLAREAVSWAGEGLAGDPGMVALNRQWEACMNSKGYVFDQSYVGAGPDAALNLAVRTRPDGSVGPPNTDTATEDIPAEEKGLLGTGPERVVALADFDCRAETDYLARLTQIRVERDTAFIEAHRAELDRLVDAAQSW
jgi:hypothetical protein